MQNERSNEMAKRERARADQSANRWAGAALAAMLGLAASGSAMAEGHRALSAPAGGVGDLDRGLRTGGDCIALPERDRAADVFDLRIGRPDAAESSAVGGAGDLDSGRLVDLSARAAAAAVVRSAEAFDHRAGGIITHGASAALTADADALARAVAAGLEDEIAKRVAWVDARGGRIERPDEVYRRRMDELEAAARRRAARVLSVWSGSLTARFGIPNPGLAALSARADRYLGAVAIEMAASIREELEDEFTLPRRGGSGGDEDAFSSPN